MVYFNHPDASNAISRTTSRATSALSILSV